MTLNGEKMKKKVEKYFDDVSDEQLQKDLKEAGYQMPQLTKGAYLGNQPYQRP